MISGVHVCVLVVTPMCLHISGSPDQWCTIHVYVFKYHMANGVHVR